MSILISGCATVDCKGIGPGRDIYYMVPGSCEGEIFIIEIEKGEFDLPEKDRGYKIFHSKEEIMEFIREFMSKESV